MNIHGSVRPKVNIGVPTYNRVGLLARGIELILTQDYEHLEMVVSDNASTDGTQEFCLALARKDRGFALPGNLTTSDQSRISLRCCGLQRTSSISHMSDDGALRLLLTGVRNRGYTVKFTGEMRA